MNPAEDTNRRVYHRLGFDAQLELERLDDSLLQDSEKLRTRIKRDLRMLHWLQLDNQYRFVRDSAQRVKPALAPLIRLVDAKLNFLAGELFSRHSAASPMQSIEMSATGLAFDWTEQLPPGSLWLVTVDPDGVDAPLKVPAIVQRAAEDESGSKSVAMEFFGLTEDETDALASWIVARQAQELSRRREAED
jgi:hypothetical protein